MIAREAILDEIRRTAAENGGAPLGTRRFQAETGISSYEWGRYWARFGDAVREAGFEPNRLQGPFPEKFLLSKLACLTRKLGRPPTFRDIQAEKVSDPEMPDRKVFQRLGTKTAIVRKITEFCKQAAEYADVIALLPEPPPPIRPMDEHSAPGTDNIGEVYLFKFGRYYKIGRTNDTVRRGQELRIQLPENPVLIHSIKTDDPSGVETYWKNRFRSKMMNAKSEFFELDRRDVRAFKRWKRIY